MSYNDMLDREIILEVPMGFREQHLQDASSILQDLQSASNALDLLIRAGKAIELAETDLQDDPNRRLEVNGAVLPYRKIRELIESARSGREFSYAPYSHFNVGAAILAEDLAGMQRIITGCNVENAAYGSTICAERTAAFMAVSERFRIFRAYAVVGGFDDSRPQQLRDTAADEYITPCGSCRQVTNEFEANPCMVIVATDTGKILVSTLEFLLPAAFGPKNLGVDATSYDRHNKT